MNLSLLVLNTGKSEIKTIPVAVAEFVIGRAPECQLRPSSSVISKRHCAVVVRDGKVYLRDFQSTNGTFVNDQRVEDEVELHHDDCLKVGPLNFKVQIEARVPAKKLVHAARKPADEESVAEMLLALEEETIVAEDEVEEDIDDSEETPDAPDPAGDTETQEMALGRAANGASAPKKPASGDTSGAAKSILEKYMRRPRPT